MRPLLRAIPLVLIYAVLAGPADPANWLAGAVPGLGLALVLGARGPALGPGGALGVLARALVLPWFLLGCLRRIASGSWTMFRVLAFRAGRAELGFVRCETETETPDGAALLALIEAASADSIVTRLDDGAMRVSLVAARRRDRHCADQRRWYRRFQRRMLP